MPASPTRILYIDDDADLCRLVQKVLERQGYAVDIAADGAAGLARIAKGDIDVVALDHYMPIQDGMETLVRIRDSANPPPVIYVTAVQDVQVAVAALKAGAADYVVKDASGEFLLLLQRSIDAVVDAVMLRRARDFAESESVRNAHLTQSIVDTIRDPLVVLEQDMTMVLASQSFLTMFGISEAQTRGRLVFELGEHQWDVPALRDLMKQVIPENQPIENFEIEDDFPGLGRRVFSLHARKISRIGNHVHRMLLVFEDITDRKQRQRDAQMLTNEVSHRIKNSLQIVNGLLTFEARSMPPLYAQGYRAMQSRIGAIAQLYDLISQSSRVGTIALDAYLKEIANIMTASFLSDGSGIRIEVSAEALQIDPVRAVPFGLLVNELGTNALKHAFPNGTGRVVLSVAQAGEKIELTVADDGIGMKNSDVAKPPEKRGADYVAIFVRQLDGTIATSASEGSGTTITVRFPALQVATGTSACVAA